MLFVILSLKSNSDQETLNSSLGVGFSVTSLHLTQLLGQQQQLFQNCGWPWNLAAAEADMHVMQAVYLPYAVLKSKCFNTYKKGEGKPFVLEFYREKQISGHSLKGIATPVMTCKTTNHFHSTRRKLYASDETLHCAS